MNREIRKFVCWMGGGAVEVDRLRQFESLESMVSLGAGLPFPFLSFPSVPEGKAFATVETGEEISGGFSSWRGYCFTIGCGSGKL
jgi:hypothetical protein